MNSCVQLRPATERDIGVIERVVANAYRPYISRIGREPAPMTADYHAAVASSRVSVLVEDARVVGALVMSNHNDHVLIENVAVDPSAQGRGLGRMLLNHAEQEARRLGHSQVRLYTNAAMTENLSFYPRLGYTAVRRARQDGFDRVFFVKCLH